MGTRGILLLVVSLETEGEESIDPPEDLEVSKRFPLEACLALVSLGLTGELREGRLLWLTKVCLWLPSLEFLDVREVLW